MLKFFKSFPFLSAATIQAAIALAVALGFHLTAVQTGSIEAAAAAVLALLTVRHITPFPVPLFTGALTALGTLTVAFRWPGVNSAEVSAFVTLIASLLGTGGHVAVQNKLLAAERAQRRAMEVAHN